MDFFDILSSVYFSALIFLGKHIDDWLLFSIEVVKTLQQAFSIIVDSSWRFSSFHDPIAHFFFWNIKMEDAFEVDFVTHYLVPTVQVVLVSWEAINQEKLFPASLFHCCF